MAGALTSHLLPDHIIQKVVSKKQLPMNPHKQRLLVAEAKSATLETSKKTPKVGKGKAATKSKAKVATPSDTGDDSATSRSAYSAAKKAYMDKLLDLCDRKI